MSSAPPGDMVEEPAVARVPVRAQRGPQQLLGEHQVGFVAGRLVEVQQRPRGVHLVGEQSAHSPPARAVRDALAGLVAGEQHALERLQREAPELDVVRATAPTRSHATAACAFASVNSVRSTTGGSSVRRIDALTA